MGLLTMRRPRRGAADARRTFAAGLAILLASAPPAGVRAEDADVAAVADVAVVARPDPVYVERTDDLLSVPVDFEISNRSASEYEVISIKMRAYDRGARLVDAREVNFNGDRPSMETLGKTIVPPRGRLLVFNPFQRMDAALDVASLEFAFAIERQPDRKHVERLTVVVRPQSYPQAVPFALPVAGRYLVWDGHDLPAHHRRWDYSAPDLVAQGYASNAARYAVDLIAIDEKGERARGDEQVNANWLGFGRPVFAVADGDVVAARDASEDNRRFDPAQAGGDRNAVFGNYVVLRHGDGSYSLYGHIQQSSLQVRVGARVRKGDMLARIGAAGDSLFPHLHYQRANGPDDFAEGLPAVFGGYRRVTGASAKPVARGALDSGQVIISGRRDR